MSSKPLDPKTATPEEVAAAFRRMQSYRRLTALAALAAGLLTWFVIVPGPPGPRDIPATAIGVAVGYFAADLILRRI
jgi:hypothetical protein